MRDGGAGEAEVITDDWCEQEQLTKPYYATLWEKSKPLWVGDGELIRT